MAMIKENPIRSVGINMVPKTITLETVAESGSTVPMISRRRGMRRLVTHE